MNTPDPVSGHINNPLTRQYTTRRPADPVDAALGDGPLHVPVQWLREALGALVREGRLLGVDLETEHPDCPCFLLRVAADLPRLYVEVFLDEADDDEDDAGDATDRSLLVLVNWLGEDTDPAIFELDPALLAGDPSRLGPALAPVLEHVLRVTQARQP